MCVGVEASHCPCTLVHGEKHFCHPIKEGKLIIQRKKAVKVILSEIYFL
jgi:hypothetical protein